MDVRRFNRVRDEAETAVRALSLLARSRTEFDCTREWGVFLRAFKSFFTHCEQLAKTDNALGPWFGREKAKFKGDPLISYLLRARDQFEHCGHPPINFHSQGQFQEGVPITLITRMGSNFASDLEIAPDTPGLKRTREIAPFFHNREKRQYDLPQTHMGLKLDSYDLDHIGGQAASYLEHLLARIYERADELTRASKPAP